MVRFEVGHGTAHLHLLVGKCKSRLLLHSFDVLEQFGPDTPTHSHEIVHESLVLLVLVALPLDLGQILNDLLDALPVLSHLVFNVIFYLILFFLDFRQFFVRAVDPLLPILFHQVQLLLQFVHLVVERLSFSF